MYDALNVKKSVQNRFRKHAWQHLPQQFMYGFQDSFLEGQNQ